MNLPLNGFAINHNWKDVFKKYGYKIGTVTGYGPTGIVFRIWKEDESGRVLVTQSDHPETGDSTEWLHASISYNTVVPAYEDLYVLHRAVFGRKRYSYQLFVPESSHVNIHARALHLWGRADGKPAMPDFGAIKGTI